MHTGTHPARAAAVSTMHRRALAPRWEEGRGHKELQPLAILVRLARAKYCCGSWGQSASPFAHAAMCGCQAVLKEQGRAGGMGRGQGSSAHGAGSLQRGRSGKFVLKTNISHGFSLSSPHQYFTSRLCKAGSTGFGSIFNLDYFNWDLGMGKRP